MSRAKKDRVVITARVQQQLFTFQEDRKVALYEAYYQRYRNGTPGNLIHVWFPVTSAWLDQQTNKVLRAHLQLTRNLQQMRFYQDVLRLRLVDTVEQQGLQASATSATRVLYYGYDGEQTLRRYDRETGNNFFYFNSKALALREILKNIQHYRAIGGLNFASLNTVSDDVLQSVGFEKIEDIIGQSPAMWRGNPDIMGNLSYRDKDRKEMANFFLELLGAELQDEPSPPSTTSTGEAA